MFEKYVEIQLLNQLDQSSSLESQKSNQYLASYVPENTLKPKNIFNMKPDLAINYPCALSGLSKYLILDTRWKLLDSKADGHFGLQQSDLYQMFAYNHMYQGHAADIVLIYPKHAQFEKALEPLKFKIHLDLDPQLQPKVWVLPFDLSTGQLELSGHDIAGLQLKMND